MVTGGVGLATAVIVGHAVIVGSRVRAAAAAVVQAVTAAALLVWWVSTDFWQGAAHSATLPLIAVLVLDAIVLLWAATGIEGRAS